jgi:hypothetical protein
MSFGPFTASAWRQSLFLQLRRDGVRYVFEPPGCSDDVVVVVVEYASTPGFCAHISHNPKSPSQAGPYTPSLDLAPTHDEALDQLFAKYEMAYDTGGGVPVHSLSWVSSANPHNPASFYCK